MADTGPQPDLDSKRTGDFLSARAAQNENEKEASARESQIASVLIRGPSSDQINQSGSQGPNQTAGGTSHRPEYRRAQTTGGPGSDKIDAFFQDVHDSVRGNTPGRTPGRGRNDPYDKLSNPPKPARFNTNVSPTKKKFTKMSEREKADAYFTEKENHMQLKYNYRVLEENLQKMRAQMQRLGTTAKYDRKQAEILSRNTIDAHSATIPDMGGDIQSLIDMNQKLKGDLKAARITIAKANMKGGKSGFANSTVGRKVSHKNRVAGGKANTLISTMKGTVDRDHIHLVNSLRGQLEVANLEIQRLNETNLNKSGYDPTRSHSPLVDNSLEVEALKKRLNDEHKQVKDQQLRISELERELKVQGLSSQTQISGYGTSDLAHKVSELTAEKKVLEGRIRELCSNPFIKKHDERSFINKSQLDREREAGQNIEKRYTDQLRDLQEKERYLNQEMQRKDKDLEKLREENIRLQVSSGKYTEFEEQLRAMGQDTDAFMRALGVMKLHGEEPAWARLDFLERGSTTAGDVHSLRREIERLKNEKAQIAAELEKAHTMMAMKSDIDKERNSMHERESESYKFQLQSAQQRAEDLAKLADFRANRVVQLEKNQRLNVYDDQSRIVASKTEFRISEVEGIEEFGGDLDTEIGTGENVLDLWLGEAEFYEVAVSQIMGQNYYNEQGFASFLTVDFYNHETQTSSFSEGLKPVYNVHISFKVNVDDFFLQFLERDGITFEANSARGQQHVTFGEGRIPLKELLERAGPMSETSNRTSIIEAAAPVVSVSDQKTSIGVIRYKLRMRLPLSEALRWYREKQEVIELTRPTLQAVDVSYVHDAKPSTRRLHIIVFRCIGLVPQTYSPDISPFVFYQFANEAERATGTSRGPDPIFDDTNTIELQVNNALKRYLDKEALQVAVFDDNAPIRDVGQDVIGTAHIPLSSLLIDTAVDGQFPLYNQQGQNTGHIHVRIAWFDSKADSIGYGSPLTQVWERDVYERIARNLIERGLNLQSAFKIFDQDNDGQISPEEFRNTILITLRMPISEQEIQQLINACHTVNGSITQTEFNNKFSSLLPANSGHAQAGTWQDSIVDMVRQRIREKGLDIRQAFNAFDENKDGFIDNGEFKRTFRIMDLGLTENEIDRLLQWFDPNMTGRLRYQEFCDKLLESPRVGPAGGKDPHGIMAKLGRIVKDQGLSLRQAFEVFDTNKDGKIEKKEFLNVFQNVKANLSFAELEELWDGLPKDTYGYLNYREFCASMESNPMPSSRTETQRDSIMKVRQRIAQILRSRNITVHAVFVTFDRNNSGKLSRAEFRNALEHLKLNLSTYDIETLLQEADSNKDGLIDYNEFCKFLSPPGGVVDTFKEHMRRIGKSLPDLFNIFDTNKDGTISQQEFREACNNLDLGLSSFEVEQLILIIDKTRNGTISYNEFNLILTTPTEEEKRNQSPGRTPGRPGPEPSPGRPLDAEQQTIEEIAKVIKNAGIKLRDAFSSFDTDNSGTISRTELKTALTAMKLGLTAIQMEHILKEFDVNRDGEIDYNEFAGVFQKYGVIDTQFYDQRKRIRTVLELIKLIEDYLMKNHKTLINMFMYLFDVNKDSHISRDELATGFNKLTNNPLTQHEVDSLMNEICPGQTRFKFEQLRAVYNSRVGNSPKRTQQSREGLLAANAEMEESLTGSRIVNQQSWSPEKNSASNIPTQQPVQTKLYGASASYRT